MSRRGKYKKREILPDPIYNSVLVAKLINKVMRDGKKSLAQRLVYQAFEMIKKQGKDPLVVFEAALRNVGPQMEVRPRRVGGASYQVPMPVSNKRRLSLAIRWLVQYANARPNKEYHTFSEKLAAELLDAAEGKGEAVRRKEITHKMAEANKAFAHFRW